MAGQPHPVRALITASAVAALLLAGGCRGGCQGPAQPAAVDPTLALLPAEVRLVASVDLARIRTTPLWTRVAALAADDPADRRRIETLTARTGLDPLRQIHRITAAFPDDARTAGQFALIIDGEGFDEKRLVAYARQEAASRGVTVEARTHGAHTLWTSAGPERTAGFFLGPGRFVLGSGGWGEAVADLVDQRSRPPDRAATPLRSAADNAELVRLATRIGRRAGRALWFAAIVPLDVRRLLMADPRGDTAASVTRLAAAADLGPVLDAEMVADLSNSEDARLLVERINTSVRQAKGNARVLMLGLGPYLDALTARAEGPTLRVTVSLAEPQVKDLLDRLSAFARLARAAPGKP